jgi:hypothetical protein
MKSHAQKASFCFLLQYAETLYCNMQKFYIGQQTCNLYERQFDAQKAFSINQNTEVGCILQPKRRKHVISQSYWFNTKENERKFISKTAHHAQQALLEFISWARSLLDLNNFLKNSSPGWIWLNGIFRSQGIVYIFGSFWSYAPWI